VISFLRSSIPTRGAILAGVTLLLALATPVRASVLVLYPFNNNADGNNGFKAASFNSGALTSVTLTAGSGLGTFAVGTDSLLGPNYSSIQFLKVGPGSVVSTPTASTAINNNWYFDVVLTPRTTMSIDSIEVDWTRNSSSGVRGWFVRSSSDSYVTNLFSSETPAGTATGIQHATINLSGFSGLNTATTFRFYVYSNATLRFVDFQNLQFNGSSPASGVPESSTSTLMLVGLACGGCALWRRRR
jgi:hypothetical protein